MMLEKCLTNPHGETHQSTKAAYDAKGMMQTDMTYRPQNYTDPVDRTYGQL
jgi:hypothetical protein